MTAEEIMQRARSSTQYKEKHSAQSKSAEEIMNSARQEKFQRDVSKVDKDYLDLFTKSANDFFSSAQVDIGWDNASSVYQKSRKTLDDLDYRRSVISSWLASNKDSLEADSYKSLSDAMEFFTSDSNTIMSYLTEAKDYYDKDKNQDAYLAYVDHQNKMNYDLTAGKQKIGDLNRAMELEKELEDDQYILENWPGHDWLEPSKEMLEEQAILVRRIERNKLELSRLKDQYGLEGNLSELTAAENIMFRESEAVQKEAKLSAVVDSPDFEKYSQKGAEIKKKGGYTRDSKDMTDEEKAIADYYVGKEDEESFAEYMDAIENRIKAKRGERWAGKIEDKPLLELATFPVVGVDQFATGVKGLWKAAFSDDDYVSPSSIQYAGQAIKEDLRDTGPEWVGKGLEVAYDLGTTSANMAPYILASIAVGTVSKTAGVLTGRALMGASAAGNAYIDKLNKGYSQEQARAYGAMVGASEVLLETALNGIGALGKGVIPTKILSKLDDVDNILAKVAKSVPGQMAMSGLSEGMEEGIQAILEPAIWGIVSGEDFTVEKQEVLYSSLLGFLSGGVFEAGGMAVDTIGLNRAAKKTYGNNQSELVTESLEIDPDNKFAQKMQSKVNDGKNLRGSQIRKLIGQNDSTMVNQDIASIQKATEATLTERGETGDVKAISEAIAKKTAGKSLTKEEWATITESKYGREVMRELDPENILRGDHSTEWTGSIGTNKINANEYGKLLADAEASVSGEVAEAVLVKNDIASIQKAAEAILVKFGETGDVKVISEAIAKQTAGKPLTMEESMAILDSLYASVVYEELGLYDIQVDDFNTAQTGTVTVNPLRTGEINEADSTISAEAQETTSAPVASVSIEEVSKKYGAQAKAMVATYNQGQDVAKFDRAYSIAYDMGKSNVGYSYVEKSDATGYLTDEQKKLAYSAGVSASEDWATSWDKQLNSGKKGNGAHKEGRVSADKGVKMSDLRKTFNDPQNKAYKALVTIAKATGINIVLTKSKVDSQGRLIGNQGEFKWDNDTIYIDINAGVNYAMDTGELTKYSMLRTFGHEFTHFIEKNAPVEYNALRKLVFEEIAKRPGGDVDYLIKKKQLLYKDENLSYEAASREVVAESMSDMLRDTSFIEKLTQKHQTLAQKLLGKLKEFLANIKSYFDNLAKNPSTEANAIQQEMNGAMKYLESIIEAFDKAAVAAVENYQGISSETTVAEVSEQIDSGIAKAMGPDGIALQTPDGSVAVVAKPSENGIESVIVDSGAWDTQKSIRTYNEDILTDEDGNTISGKDLFRNLMKDNGFSDTDIDSAVKRMDSIIDVLTNDFAAFGKLQDNLQKGITTNILNPRQRVLFAMISNGDYPVNGELSTTCVNRQAFQNMFEKLVESGIMKDVVFNSAAIAEMNAILRDHGYLTACFSCFVEARRVRVQKWAENFVSKWNEVALKRGAKDQFGFFKNRENPEAMAKGDIFDIEEQLSQVDKNDQGNVALPKGNVTKKINVLLDKVPSLTKLLTVEDIMSVGGLNAMRRFGEGGQNVFALLKSSYGTASPKISQDFEAYGGDFAKMSFEYIKDTLGKSIPGAQDLVRKIATQKTEATFEGKSYTKKAYSEEYSKNLNSAATKREALREYLYSIAGIRYQSFSDFDITQVFDKMQVFNDIAANRAPLHEYTKVISDIRIFGMTGGKMNASVIHQVDPSLGKENAGLVRLENGQLGYVADDRRHYEQSGKKNPHRAPQSIDYMDAVALMLDPRYSPNMGTIAIGFSNKHIEMMLDDNNIRMIIPYHRSGLPTLYMHLTGLSAINADGKTELIVEDYTDTQTASVKELYNSKGKPVNQNSLTKANRKKLREAAMEWKFAEHLNKNNGDPRKTAKEYLEWCASDHVFVTKDGKEFHFTVKPAFDQFSYHDNYYKVLIDFDPYDPVTGEIAKQGPVRISYAGDSEATTLNEQQLAEYRERLEATNMYTAEQIDGYMRWAQQDLMDILREELSKEQKYIESTDAQAGPAFDKISNLLMTKYNRATYNENTVMAEYGIAAEQKSKETSYRQDMVLHESDFDDENRVQKSIRTYEDDYAPTFYSQMEKVVSGMKQNKFGASSVVDMLRGRGVKAEEIKWSGIEAWLEGKKSVTKTELQEFIAGSMLQVVEEQSDPDSLALKYIGNNTYKLYGADGNVLDTFVFNKFMEGYVSENTEEIYSTTYEIEDAVREEYGSQSLPRWSDYKLKGGTNYREIVFRLPNNNYSNKAMKIHWGDDAEGVLAHARIQDFTVNGKKMLFVEELQSDYHNEGHGSGYSDSKTEDRIEALKAVADEKFFALEDYSTEMTGVAGEWETVEKTVKGARLLLEHREAQTAYDKAMDEFMKQVPDAPFKDTYHEYVMKRLLRMAAEQGYDSIGWTTSETQIERWTDEFEKGFRIEYDQDIPKFLAKYGKKWGATVSKTQNSPNGITIWQMNIPEAMQDSVLYEGQAQYQKRTNTLTDHEILDMAAKELDTSKLTDAEKSALDIFRKRVDKLKALKEERQKQGSIFYEHQFGANKDTAKATAARNRMTVLDNQITKASAEVLGLEDKKVLKDVLQKSRKVIEQKERKESLERIRVAREETRAKERKIANEKLEALRQKKNERIAEVRAEERQKAHEKAEEKVENRKKTEIRVKIQKQLSELNSLLQNGNKKKNVKHGMKDTASALLAYGELLFSEDTNVSPETMVRNGIETDLTDKESQLLNEYTDLLEKRDLYLGQINEAASGTDANKDARIEGLQKMVDIINQKKLPALIKKLEGVFERERARLNKVTFSAVLKDITDSYKALEKSKDPFVSGAYNAYVYDRLVAMNNPNAGVATTIKDMSLAQLAELNDAIKMVVTSIKNANALFRNGQKEVLSERAEQVFMEIRKLYRNGGDPTAFKHAVTDKIKSFAWNELKPIYAFERIGSDKFTELFWDVINGESEYGLECDKAADFVRELRESSGYKKWDFDKVKVFKTADGQDFKLTLGDMMSIYAYSRRDQAHKHMFEGGFTFHTGKTETYKDTDGKKRVRLVSEDTYRMTPELLDKILSSLNKEQKAYAEAMQDYLTKLGEMGNKVSRILYGIDLFKETHYFPLKSDRDYRSTVETQLNQTQTAASLVNIGMAKETVPEASNPIVLQRFDDVAVQHIDQMLKYSSMVLPIENLRKVMDFAPGEFGTWNAPVKKLISTVHGVSASQYVNQWITDLNGSSGLDGAKNPLSSMFARSKKVAVAGNLSVVSQQYFAVARAMSEIDGKYFFSSDGKTDGSQWEELKKWAGVAVIKDIGGFDMGSARSATEYIGKAGAKTGIGDKIDKAASYGSAKMDELGWGTIWRAAKAEIADTTDLKVGTEEFFKASAKRFTEIVVKTQVYDSVTARSGFMRSKRDSVKYLVSFMGEPTTTVNMMLNAQMKLIRAKRSGNKADLKKARAYMARTSGAVILSTVLGIIAKSVVYAMRDDDETESFLERYVKQIGSSFHQELNPLNLLPVARDIMSMIKGRDIERPDMALISSTIKAFKKALKADENQLEAWVDVVLSVGNMLGIPLKNVLRDGAGVVRLIGDITDDIGPKDLGKTFFKEGFLGKEATKNENLYAAIVSEDTGRLEVLKKGYKSDTDYTNAVRKALRECDDRIQVAAKARFEGDTMTYMELAKEIIAEGNFIQDDVVAAIMSEVTAMENEAAGEKESSPKVYSMYTVADYLSVVDQPKASKEIKDYLINKYLDKGKTNAEAEAEFKSDLKDQVKTWYTDEESETRITKQQAMDMLKKYVGMKPDEVTSTINQWSSKVVTGIAYDDIKDEFMAGKMTASRAIEMRVRYGSKSKEDAAAEVSAWNAEKKYGLSSDIAKAYTKTIKHIGKSAEQVGIKADVFTRYKDLCKTAGSKKEDIMDVIHSLPLTVDQKDALYYYNDWSPKTINEAPWH